jgi:hypothetical protein
MNCGKCGAENPPEAKFCGVCAAALTPSGGTGQAEWPPVDQGMKVGIAIASVLFGIVGVVMGIIFMNDPNPNKKAAGKLWLIIGCCSMALGCVCTIMMGALGSAAHY